MVADITKLNSLSAELFQGVRAVICCTAVRVSPKEGDTENRDKYKQVRPCCSIGMHLIPSVWHACNRCKHVH